MFFKGRINKKRFALRKPFYYFLFCRFFRRNCQPAVIITAVWTNSVSRFRLVALGALRYSRGPSVSNALFSYVYAASTFYSLVLPFSHTSLKVKTIPLILQTDLSHPYLPVYIRTSRGSGSAPHVGQMPRHSSLHKKSMRQTQMIASYTSLSAIVRRLRRYTLLLPYRSERSFHRNDRLFHLHIVKTPVTNGVQNRSNFPLTRNIRLSATYSALSSSGFAKLMSSPKAGAPSYWKI